MLCVFEQLNSLKLYIFLLYIYVTAAGNVLLTLKKKEQMPPAVAYDSQAVECTQYHVFCCPLLYFVILVFLLLRIVSV